MINGKEIWGKLYPWASKGAIKKDVPDIPDEEEKLIQTLIKLSAAHHSDKVEDILIITAKAIESAPDDPGEHDVIPVAKVIDILQQIKSIAERLD